VLLVFLIFCVVFVFYCLVFLCPVSYVANVASVFGLSILIVPSGFSSVYLIGEVRLDLHNKLTGETTGLG
jgi:hypothetical protein